MPRRKKNASRSPRRPLSLSLDIADGIFSGTSLEFETAVTARLDARRMLSSGGTINILFSRFQELLAMAQKVSSGEEKKILLAEARGISQVILEELRKKEVENV